MEDMKLTIEQFRVVAREYIELIEKCSSMSRRQLVERAHRTLVDLYRLGASLSNVDSDADEITKDQVGHDQWSNMYGQLRAKLADADVYWMVFDPADPDDKEATQHTLSDDLSDIYREIKNAVPVNEFAPFDNNALWTLRFKYEIYWGHHAVNALTAQHSLLCVPSYLIDD